jgi:hypothetical protein
MDMMRPLVLLKDQVTALETAFTEHGQQQQLLSAGLLRVEREQRNQGDPRTPNNINRRRAGDDDAFPTTHKMEFPKYDGVEDLLSWLNRCERYFREWRTPEDRHVAYASFYPTDKVQLWYHRLELNAGPPPWTRFVQLVNKHFKPPLTESPIGELALLHRDSSVDDFAMKLMALSCRDTTIMEAHQVQLFLSGLGKSLRTDVAMQRPGTMDATVMLVRAYEQRDVVTTPVAHVPGRGPSCHTPLPSPTTASTPTRHRPPQPPSRRPLSSVSCQQKSRNAEKTAVFPLR